MVSWTKEAVEELVCISKEEQIGFADGFDKEREKQEESKMTPMGFAQEIRRTEMPITGMRDKAGGRSWEGREGLGIVIQNMFSLRCWFMKGVKA